MNVSELICKYWAQFWFQPTTARPIAALRIGLGVCLLLQVFMLSDVTFDLLSRDGIVQGSLADLLSSTSVPRVVTFMNAFSALGWSEGAWIQILGWAFVIALLLMTVGLATRAATVCTWFLHWTLTNSAYSTSYGVDLFVHVFLFYLIWMPAGDVWSLDQKLRQWRAGAPLPPRRSIAARIGLRVLQLHLCIMYLSSGIEKALGVQWWNGELLCRALMLPEYRVYDMSWLANWPHLSQILGISTLVIEIGYIVFIWPKRTRALWVLAVVGLHLGIAIFLNLFSFGVIMAVLTAAVFGVSSEDGWSPWKASSVSRG